MRAPPSAPRRGTRWLWCYLFCRLGVPCCLRDVEDLLAERGIMLSYGTVRRWVNHFGPLIAADLRKIAPSPTRPGIWMKYI
jgi:transposase-like protein